MAWNTVLPRLGTRCVNVRVRYRASYARAKQRMATENWGAHQGGGRAVIQDDSAFALSDGDPVYNASTATGARLKETQLSSGLSLAG